MNVYVLKWAIPALLVLIGNYCLGVVLFRGKDQRPSAHIRDRVLASVTPYTARAKALIVIGGLALVAVLCSVASFGSVVSAMREFFFDYPLSAEIEYQQFDAIENRATAELEKRLGLVVSGAYVADQRVYVLMSADEYKRLNIKNPQTLRRHPKKPGRMITAGALDQMQKIADAYPYFMELGAAATLLLASFVFGLTATALAGCCFLPIHLQQVLKRKRVDRIFWNLHWEEYPRYKVVRAGVLTRYLRIHPYLFIGHALQEGPRIRFVHRGIKPGQGPVVGVLVPVFKSKFIREWNREVFFPQSLIDEIEDYKNQSGRLKAS